MDNKISISFISFAIFLILLDSISFYTGYYSASKKYSSTIDSIIVDNEKWWKHFDELSVDFYAWKAIKSVEIEFENHSEISNEN